MLDDTTYQGRLARLMGECFLTPASIARNLNISKQAVSKALDGTTKMLAADNHCRLCAMHGINPLWLATGEGSMRAAAAHQDGDLPQALATVAQLLQGATGPTKTAARSMLHEFIDHPEMRDDVASALQALIGKRLSAA